MKPSPAGNLIHLMQLIKASRDLWYLNDVPELSERLYGGLSGKALKKKASRHNKSRDVETKRKAALAFEYISVRQKFENLEDATQNIEWLLKYEPSLLNLSVDLSNVGLNYIDQCIEHGKLLVPREMDEIVLGKYAQCYDNLIFYDKTFVTLVHEHEGKCDIHTIKDETNAVHVQQDVGIEELHSDEGILSIMPHLEEFEGPQEKACEYIRSKQNDLNIICTSSVPLCHYVSERYTHMRIWEVFKSAKIPIDVSSVFTKAIVQFSS